MKTKKKESRNKLISDRNEACMPAGGNTMNEENTWQFLSQLLDDTKPANMDLYLVKQYARLRLCDVSMLKLEYKHVFKTSCPQGFYREDMICVLMDHYIKGDCSNALGTSSQGAITQFTDGTVLKKKYKGQVHVVKCAGGAFLYKDSHFKSLTEVARYITNTNCSGPRFFASNTAINNGGADE